MKARRRGAPSVFSPFGLMFRFGVILGRRLSLRLIYLACLAGAASGLVAVLFSMGLDYATHINFEVLAGQEVLRPVGEPSFFEGGADHPRSWLLLILPMLGGLASGWLVFTFAPEAEGHGTDAVIDSFHNKAGKIRKRVPFLKAVASIITLSTGGSAGREGPIAQVGAGIGSWISDLLKLTPRERRILLLAGVSGGIGAIFRAPLGGALFGTEVLYKEDFETDAIVPCIFSSVVAYSVFTLFHGTEPIFHIPSVMFQDWRALFYYLVLGLVCAGVGALYVRIFYGMRDRIFRRIPLRNHWKPAIGGFGVGLIGFILPHTLGSGYGWLQVALMGGISIPLAAAIAGGKILTTSLTISSGGSGGVFAPSLFIGGMLGAVVGGLAQEASPHLVPNVAPFVLVGMAAFFAGIANTPVSAFVMVSEMTSGYGLMVPLMLVSVFVLTFQRRANLYEKQVRNRVKSPAHLSDFSIDIFSDLYIRDVLPKRRVELIQESSSAADILQSIKKTSDSYYPVINRDKKLVGILDFRQFREFLLDPEQGHLLIARDLMLPVVTLYLGQDCHTALSKFLETGYGQIPVVEDKSSHKIVGMLAHEDLSNAYEREITRRRAAL